MIIVLLNQLDIIMSASLCEVRTFRKVIYIFLLNVEKRNRSSTDAVYPLN